MSNAIFDLTCRLITGESLSLSRFRGQVLLVVNTASCCGFTPQYEGLEQLQRDYVARGFNVLGFPTNDFFQEPLGDQRVHEFCLRSYDVTFPMFGRVHVNGANQHPLFAMLKAQAPGLFGSRAIKWNFCKFLIDRDGRVVRRFGSFALPSLLRRHIEPLLAPAAVAQ